MSIVSADPKLNALSSPVIVRNRSLDRSFEVFRSAKGVGQAESQTDSDGTRVFRETQTLNWVIGAGVNGYSYVCGRKGHMVEAPLSFYSSGAKWDLSPGYESTDMGFDRPVTTACLSCHSGRLKSPLGADGSYSGAPFQELPIGCENCHGPGEKHILAHAPDNKTGEELGGAIVNPGKLPLRLAENICMSCHEGGDARVLQPGKNEQDFRPGAWLSETLCIFKLPAKRNSAASESDLLEHHYSEQLSRCFRASKGRLSCLTCHDVHNRPAPSQRAQYYRAKCLTCHAAKDCSLPIAQRAEDDCVACHMPKRDLKEISHSALTNHRIIRRPAEPLPEIAYNDSGPVAPGLIYVNPPEAQTAATPAMPIHSVVLLQAYQALEVRDSSLRAPFLAALAEAAKLYSSDIEFQATAGQELLKNPASSSAADAVQMLSAAVTGGARQPSTYLDLATALNRSGKPDAAIEVFKEGVLQNPFSALLHKELITALMKLRQYDLAASAMKKYLEVFPQDSLVRDLLKQLPLASDSR